MSTPRHDRPSKRQRVSYLIAPGTLIVREETVPEPAPGEALVELCAVGLCGSDVHWYRDGHIGTTALAEPLTLGHEAMGIVRALGEGAPPQLLGRRVAIEPAIPCGACPWCARGDVNLCPHVRFLGTPPTPGALRQWMTHPAALLEPLPDALSDDVGALLEPLAIAVHAVDLVRPRAGEPALIVGAGPIGLCVLLVLRAAAAPAPLVVLEPLPWRARLAEELGADEVFDPADRAAARVLEATAGWGANTLFEAAGTPSAYRLLGELAAPGAKAAIIGIDPHDRLELHHSTARRKGLTFYMVRRSRRTLARARTLAEQFAAQLERLVTHRGGLDDAPQLFERLAEYRDGIVKAILDPRH